MGRNVARKWAGKSGKQGDRIKKNPSPGCAAAKNRRDSRHPVLFIAPVPAGKDVVGEANAVGEGGGLGLE